jgi:NADH-quinone oxidoreductase subunit N
MAATTLPTLTPQIVLGLAALLVLVVDALAPEVRQTATVAGVAVVGSLVSAASAAFFLAGGTGQPASGGAFTEFGGALIVDGTSLFFSVIVGAVTALVALGSYDYVKDRHHVSTYYSMTLLAATGMSLMASANSLASVFVALELASLPSYVLVSYLKTNRGSVEAGLKYFIVGSVSSGIFVFGASLVYAATGSLLFADIAGALGSVGENTGILAVGVLMLIAGFAYKTASVPFHFWAPEAYEGAPAPISAFLSSASKAAGFVVAFRTLTAAFPLEEMVSLGIDWTLALSALALLTMTLGNFAAATQENVKRMLAYSSVGHAGYVLIGLAALGGGADDLVLGASMMHLFVYGFMNTGAFLFVALVEHWGVGRTFEDYNGLATRAPLACAAMTVFLFSLAGLPVGAGFWSKYFVLMGSFAAGYWWLAAALIVNSALSLFYYSRVVKAMWIEDPSGDFGIESRPVGLYAAVMAAAVVTVVLLVAFDPVSQTAIGAAQALL